MKRIAIAVFLCLAFASPISAMPGGGDRFTQADADKDGFLSTEEFKAAFPGLKAEAFSLIDTDKDGRISAKEWLRFSSGHGGEASPAPDSSGRDGALPLLPIPPGGSATGGGQDVSGRSSSPETATPKSNALPLLTAPSK